jgi:hypothetical protein
MVQVFDRSWALSRRTPCDRAEIVVRAGGDKVPYQQLMRVCG